ncbi:hypothetical protein JXB12_09460 [candidate division KSB1 bacterium]|nr:hypothetical protein [candidate division KSB1 bacterium]
MGEWVDYIATRRKRIMETELMTAITRKTVLPGDPGTMKLVAEYGDRLICVRYKYDVEGRRRYKTVELIIEEDVWEPDFTRIPANKFVKLAVDYEEFEIRRKIKSFGGRFNWSERVWELQYMYALQLGLEDRIIKNS